MPSINDSLEVFNLKIKNIKQEQGFLLLDSLAAIFILSVALLAIFGVIMSSNTLSSSNDDRTQAYKLAQTSMEKLKQVPPSTWKNLIPLSQTTDKVVGQIESKNGKDVYCIDNIQFPTVPSATINNKNFTTTLTAKMSSALNTGNHLVQVRVQVTWNAANAQGVSQSHIMELINYCERQE